MNKTTRRNFFKNAAAVTGGIGIGNLSAGVTILSASTKKTDIRIEDISHSYQEYLYRTPNKFAGTVVDRATIMTVRNVFDPDVDRKSTRLNSSHSQISYA